MQVKVMDGCPGSIMKAKASHHNEVNSIHYIIRGTMLTKHLPSNGLHLIH